MGKTVNSLLMVEKARRRPNLSPKFVSADVVYAFSTQQNRIEEIVSFTLKTCPTEIKVRAEVFLWTHFS